MGGAEPGGGGGDDLFQQLDGLGHPAGVAVEEGQIVHALERVGVVGPELDLLGLNGAFQELDGLGLAADGPVCVRQVDRIPEGVGVVGPELGRPCGGDFLEDFDGIRQPARVLVPRRARMFMLLSVS